LALASAIKHASMPVLVVNCEPTLTSSAQFEKLMTQWDFDLIDAPTLPHGRALDRLFRGLRDEVILLLDSDAELRDPSLIEELRSALEVPAVFGAGFLNGPKWLDDRLGATPHTGLLHERPWMPCVMLRTSPVRSALDAGVSFSSRTIHNDFAWSKRVSRVLAARFQSPYTPRSRVIARLPKRIRRRLRYARLPWLEWARQDFYGRRPNYVWCDTGTDVYRWCRYQEELVFAGMHVSLLRQRVIHYQGVTRKMRRPGQRVAAELADIEGEVIERLAGIYGLEWSALAIDAGDRVP
jgi:hypothetical protein